MALNPSTQFAQSLHPAAAKAMIGREKNTVNINLGEKEKNYWNLTALRFGRMFFFNGT